MRKIIAAINVTIDGFCDHTAGIADEELHQHYTDLLLDSGDILYGRTTYQLMESYWPLVVKNPTGNKATDNFAHAIDKIPKTVFSHTLNRFEWKNAALAKRSLEEELSVLKQQPGKDILIGSPSLISESMRLNLADEYQLCVHPVVIGNGLRLFKNIDERKVLKLFKTKTFGNGQILLYYQPTEK